VSVAGSLGVDGLEEIQLLDDDTGTEVEVALDNGEDLVVRLGAGTVGVDEDGGGLGNTNGVGELDQGTAGETGVDDGLGDPASSVGSGTIDLGPILSRESSTTVGTVTTVGVDNDLASGDTGISLGTTDDELAGRLEMVDGLGGEVLGGDDLLDDLLLEGLAEGLVVNILRVLDGDDDGVDAEGNQSTTLVLVLDGDLGLGVRAKVGEGAIATAISHLLVELVRQDQGQGHELGGLIGSVTEHDTLITSSDVLNVEALLDETLVNIGRLLLNGDKNVAGLVVETLGGVIVSNVLDGVADNLLVIQSGLGGDLTENHDHTGLGSSLASNLGHGVLLEASIQNGVRNLIADLV